MLYWVLVKGVNLRYHNEETRLFTIDPKYGNINLNPLARTQFRVWGFRLSRGLRGFLGAGFRFLIWLLGLWGFEGLRSRPLVV